jgi:hypothetical protein
MNLRLASAVVDEDDNNNDQVPQPQAAAEPLEKPAIIE